MRQVIGVCGEGSGAFGPHQEPAKAANPEIAFVIGYNRAPLVWNDTRFTTENGDAFRPQAAQPVAAAKPYCSVRIDVYAITGAITDLVEILVMAIHASLPPRLTGL